MNCQELALKKVKIDGNILGKLGAFEINQIFKNETKECLEVEYTFPMIETATIVKFEAKINEKILKGICKEKEEAKKEYQRNIVSGNSAYLMEEETPNIFKISLGKIAPQEIVEIKIKYIDTFEMVDNKIKIMIPTLVTPRYKSYETINLGYGKVDYTVDFKIKIEDNVKTKSIYSPSHEIKVIDNNEIEVLAYDMSRDFKLELELKNELTSNGLYSKTRDNKNIVYLSFMPEILDKYADEEKEYLFLIDVSGSMIGEKIEQTKSAVIQCLQQLDEGDKFNIIKFDNKFSAMNMSAIAVNDDNIEKAIEYIDTLKAWGGTEILKPLMFSLYEKPSNKTILLFTDGQVGNEAQILQYVRENIGKNRLFAFGIDSNVNAYFIKELSKVGNGKGELIQPKERIDDAILRTFARIQTPMLENVKIDYGKNKILDEIKEDENLFNYEFYNVITELEGIEDDIKLKGEILGKKYEWTIKKEELKESNVDLELVFAKKSINRLMQYIRNSRDCLKTENYKEMIRDIAIKYNINSPYTSFIIVNERDEKIFDVPQYQSITLSSGAFRGRGSAMGGRSKVAMRLGSLNNNMDMGDFEETPFLRKNTSAVDKEMGELQQRVYTYFEKFIKLENKEILTYLLYAIYYRKINKVFNMNEFIHFLTSKQEEIKSNEIYMKLIVLLYNNLPSTEEINKKKLLNLLNDDYKKVAYSGMTLDIKLESITDSDIKSTLKNDDIEDNICRIIWYLSKNVLNYI